MPSVVSCKVADAKCCVIATLLMLSVVFFTFFEYNVIGEALDVMALEKPITFRFRF